MDTHSPFSISDEAQSLLESSEGFRIVRTYLSNEENYPFCTSHAALSADIQSTFTLHRDILHSLLLPLLQIRSQAAHFASRALSNRHPSCSPSRSPSRSIVDLELAFRGQARGAFSWLQCFVAEERDWCATRGCAACVVLKVLHAEPFIRIVVAACRLSNYLKSLLESQPMDNSQNAIKTASSSNGLPTFEFWLTAVHNAVSEDEFWGLHFWEDIEARAEDLESGIKDLISQCSVPPTSLAAEAGQQQTRNLAGTSVVWTHPGVKNGKMVKRHIMLREEEQQWMRKIVEACWKTLLTEAARERRIISITRRPVVCRMRSLTT